MKSTKKSVVLLLGSGHCGSTLLDLIISSHETTFGLGELVALAEEPAFFTGKQVSVLEDPLSPFWTPALMQQLQSEVQEDSWSYRLRRKLMPGSLRNRIRLYQEILAACPETINTLVDSSKKLWWVRSSLQQLQHSNWECYLIFLRRDPRAVINSYLRKYPDRGLKTMLEKHYRQMQKMETYFADYQGAKLLVEYEDLASQPRETTNRVTDFLGLSFDSKMLRFWEQEHVLIRGNSGTKSFILKFRDKAKALKLPTAESQAYYEKHDLGIRLDERWRVEMKEEWQQKIAEQFGLE